MILKIFLVIYPWCKAFLKLIEFTYLLRYTFGASEYHSILFQFMKLKLKRIDVSDTQNYLERIASDAEIRNNALLNNPNAWNYLLFGLRNLKSSGLELLKNALPACLFIYQFFEWWYESDAYKNSLSVPIPPPPEPIPVYF